MHNKLLLVCAAGLWRGSTVAVKTMILPARMSGAEKRERMAIMEAAISSTMAHPNIVQVSGNCNGARPISCIAVVVRPGRVSAVQAQL